MLPFARVTVIGLGLIGSSIARAVKAHMPTVRVTGYDADPEVRAIATRIQLCDDVTDTPGASVIDADLVRSRKTSPPMRSSAMSAHARKAWSPR
jgi:cyclohexadieny/prephenate dehydrogenase